VLWLSAWGARALADADYRATLQVNLLPDRTQSDVLELVQEQRRERGSVHPQGDALFALPRRYWTRICTAARIDPAVTWAHLRQESQSALARELSAARFAVSGRGEFKDEFVTCGGVDLKEVDFRTLASKRCPGLYFAGEILDVDGVTGGFNFQSAWTTGYLAGLAMAHPGRASNRYP